MDPLEPAELQISPEKVCFVVIKAREFDVKDLVTEPDPGSNPTDDKMIAVLEDHKDDPVIQELTSFIGAMNEDEQIISWRWLGRGAATTLRTTGGACGRKRRGPTTRGRRSICSACRCSATIWRKGWGFSATLRAVRINRL